MHEYIPENNLVVLFLLIVLTAGLYYFWWLARVSAIFGDDAVINVMLSVFTLGLWTVYLNLKYLQKSEMINGRDSKWVMILVYPLIPVIIQNNINEKYYPGR